MGKHREKLLFRQLLTAPPPPPLPPRSGDEQPAAARSAIPASAERCCCMHIGEVITFPVSLNESSPVNSESRKNGRGRNNNRDNTKRSFCRWKLVLRNLSVIGGAAGGGYCCVRVYSWNLSSSDPRPVGMCVCLGVGRCRGRDNSHNL